MDNKISGETRHTLQAGVGLHAHGVGGVLARKQLNEHVEQEDNGRDEGHDDADEYHSRVNHELMN